MKIVFLDIDGVLNNEDSDIIYLGGDSKLHGGFYAPELVDKFNLIVKETGAKIVLSSTWRLGLSLEDIEILLKEMGVQGEVIGKTNAFWGGHIFRGNEIYEWIYNNQDLIGEAYNDFKGYVILDDESDMLYWQRNNFVQTHGLKGLTDSNVMEAIAILKGEVGVSRGVNEYIVEFLD